jgi:signal transduction protein with GAF and PtsI domain
MEPPSQLVSSVAAIRALFGAAAASCALVTDTGDRLVFVAADGAGADRIRGVELPIGRGIAGWVVMADQAIAVRDVVRDSRFARDVAEATEYVPNVVLAAPIPLPDGEIGGVLEVLDPATDIASGWPLAVLGTYANLVGLLLAGGDGLSEAPGEADPQRLEDVVAELSRRGPDGARLATQVLSAVASYLDEGGR